MQIFIDTSTGTWGLAEDIVFVEVDEPWTIFEDMTDGDISKYGNENGDAPILSGF